MRCPSCGYVRKTEDVAPEWQCPACQVVYVKVSQRLPQHVTGRPARGPGAVQHQPSRIGSFLKPLITLALLCGIAYFGYAAAQHSPILGTVGIPIQDKGELLSYKYEELKAYENALQQVEAQIAHDRANVGTCPITGQPNQYILTQDPRPELQAKIDSIHGEIRRLETDAGK